MESGIGKLFNLLNPYNPVAVLFAIILIGVVSVLLCRIKGKLSKYVGTAILSATVIYYFFPNIYLIVMWVLVEKLHWMR